MLGNEKTCGKKNRGRGQFKIAFSNDAYVCSSDTDSSNSGSFSHYGKYVNLEGGDLGAKND